MKSETCVTVQDLRVAGFCATGLRQWVDGQGVYTVRDAISGRVAARPLLEHPDIHVRRLAEIALKRAGEI